MFKKLLVAVAILIGVFLGYVASLPADYRVARSTTIAAPPAVVFGHIDNLRKWDAWSPWAKRDPNAKVTFKGPETGRGASFSWAGNRDVGEGTMTIVDSDPAKALKIKLDFVKPFAGTSDVGFSLVPEGEQTKVTWTISGKQGFIERAICTALRIDLDKMIGDDYAKGLAALKAVAEGKRT